MNNQRSSNNRRGNNASGNNYGSNSSNRGGKSVGRRSNSYNNSYVREEGNTGNERSRGSNRKSSDRRNKYKNYGKEAAASVGRGSAAGSAAGSKTGSGSGYKSSSNSNYKSYKPNNSGSRYGSRSGSRSRYSSGGSNWGRKNRRQSRQNIPHTMYISKAEQVTAVIAHIPENSFADFNLHETLTRNISDRDYINPTKIQDQAIPEIQVGKDVLGIGNTGSGKTGAFLIPMIDKVLKNPRHKVLIITPTRELASQINNEFKKFARNTNLRMVLVMGGANIRTQINLLRSGPQFVVATPGRLMDLERRKCINLGDFNNIVLDEVDQMLDMGFVNDIKMVIAKLAEDRQSLFFSATMSHKEEAIANTLLNTPVKVESNKSSPLKSIDQDIVQVRSRGHKMEVLHGLLRKTEFHKVLVFSATKREADTISRELRQKGLQIDSLHGDKPQRKRSRILSNFRENKIDVLVATDVAARGIDIPNISHVINYDEPATYNDYIHRIGRTGRIGKKGTALTFVVSKGAKF